MAPRETAIAKNAKATGGLREKAAKVEQKQGGADQGELVFFPSLIALGGTEQQIKIARRVKATYNRHRAS
jgi:hypothetical protein